MSEGKSLRFFNCTGLDLEITGGSKTYSLSASREKPPTVVVPNGGWDTSKLKIQSAGYSSGSKAYQIPPISLRSSATAYDPDDNIDVVLGVDTRSLEDGYVAPATAVVMPLEDADNFIMLRKVCNKYIDASAIAKNYESVFKPKNDAYAVALPATYGDSTLSKTLTSRLSWFTTWIASPVYNCEQDTASSVFAWIVWIIVIVLIVVVLVILGRAGYRHWKNRNS